ncbi:tetratricopeptide repeat protein [Desulfopila sp. IMCC35006]|uniref:YfgM family protein n=1 Tax=Desulfopila sp. IMCC35006 TaxID=2569542 RepID=UPI0010AB6430|nr:tetratricopeptide repeat protein [Desulfopila sp. IMCC35006]TKB27405.1 tetratricopeptide repeat protein [Desulfopila sp. IMCC35006]
MAGESAFDKKLTAESNMDKVEGLLEHFNLPPKAIDFIRDNQRILQIGLVIIVIAIVSWALYGSYRERIQEESSTALATALQADQATQATALSAVVEKYSGTPSALWARIDIAQLDMKNGSYADAAKKYAEVLPDVKTSNPLHPLVVFGLAQALEGDKRFEEAAKQYDTLKDIKGYEQIAFTSRGRIEEEQGHIDKAIAIYNDFLLFMGDDAAYAQTQAEIKAKVARLKARQ